MEAMWVYFSIGCIAFLLALISFTLSEIGDLFHDLTSPIGDWASDHLSIGHDHEMGFSRFLNNGGMLGFIAGFGFVAALAMSQFRSTAFYAAWFGVVGGIVLGTILGLIWYLLKQSGGTESYSIEQLIDRVAVVTERIPLNGAGEVKCKMNDQWTWHIARATEGGKEILPGTAVKVIKVAGSILYVNPEKN